MNQRLRSTFVDPTSSIRSTMEAIDAGGVEIALVLDDEGRLVGTVSDGDVRRALLARASLDDPIGPYASGNPAWVGPDAERASVVDLMQARVISQVPVLDDNQRVVGLHVLHEMLGTDERANIAVVMAGGKGARLRPFTDDVPKPMLSVAGRPILERIVLGLVGNGIRAVYLAVNYHADVIENHFGDGSAFGCEIRYLHEDPNCPLGSGGPLALLPSSARIKGVPILVMNGDLVTRFALDPLLAAHQSASAKATIGARDYAKEVPFAVLVCEDDKLLSIKEKPTPVWLVNAGIYLIEPELIDRVPPGSTYPITDLFESCLERGEAVGVHRLDGDWLDVGRIDDLRRARGEQP